MSDERIQRIKKLQQEGYKVERPHSIVVNNIFALITIVVISLVVVIYVNFIQPQQQEQAKIAKEQDEQKKYFEERAKQIELSRKLNGTQD